MLKGKIIELDNNVSYTVFEEMNYGSRKFVLLSLTDLEKEQMDDENLVIKEIIMKNDSLELVDIENDKEAEDICKAILAKANKAE